jgi:hypothetical protein
MAKKKRDGDVGVVKVTESLGSIPSTAKKRGGGKREREREREREMEGQREEEEGEEGGERREGRKEGRKEEGKEFLVATCLSFGLDLFCFVLNNCCYTQFGVPFFFFFQ